MTIREHISNGLRNGDIAQGQNYNYEVTIKIVRVPKTIENTCFAVVMAHRLRTTGTGSFRHLPLVSDNIWEGFGGVHVTETFQVSKAAHCSQLLLPPSCLWLQRQALSLLLWSPCLLPCFPHPYCDSGRFLSLWNYKPTKSFYMLP